MSGDIVINAPVVNVYVTDNAALQRIEAQLGQLTQGVSEMLPELEAVQREVRENGDAVDSAVTLLGTLSDLIKANADDPVALRQIAADLDNNSQRLAAAVAANTPAASGGTGGAGTGGASMPGQTGGEGGPSAPGQAPDVGQP